MGVCLGHSDMHSVWMKEKDDDDMGVCLGPSDMHRV